jgi:hypothetical protein
MKDPSTGPTVRMVNHQAPGVPRPRPAIRPHHGLGQPENRTARGDRHDHHDEQGLGVVDLIAQVVLRGRPALAADQRDHQRNDPDAEHRLDLSEKVEHLGPETHRLRFARPERLGLPKHAQTGLMHLLVVVREMQEFGGRERVQDGQQEESRGYRVEGLDPDPMQEDLSQGETLFARRVTLQRPRKRRRIHGCTRGHSPWPLCPRAGRRKSSGREARGFERVP